MKQFLLPIFLPVLFLLSGRSFSSNHLFKNESATMQEKDSTNLRLVKHDTIQVVKVDYSIADCDKLRERFSDKKWFDDIDFEELQLVSTRLWECKVESDNALNDGAGKNGKRGIVVVTEDVDKDGKAFFVGHVIDVTSGNLTLIMNQLTAIASFNRVKGNIKNLVITSVLGTVSFASFIKMAPDQLGVFLCIPLAIKGGVLNKEIYDSIKRVKVGNIVKYGILTPAEKSVKELKRVHLRAAKAAKREADRANKELDRMQQDLLEEGARATQRVIDEGKRFAKNVGNKLGW